MININTKRILIPIDFSKTSLRAIRHGAFLAKRTKGELILLHVQKKNDLMDVILPAINIKNPTVITDFIQEKLAQLAADTRKEYGIRVTPIVSLGHVTSEIVDIADENEVGLIVMGTQGSDSANDVFLGSNAYRVLTKSEMPVLTVRTEAPKLGYSHILLPVDTAPHSRQKVKAALQLASKFASQVHVLGILGKDEDYHEFKLKVILPQIEKLAKAKKLACSGEIVKSDDRAAKTLSYAKKVNADLIICMRDETTELTKQLMLGTFSHRLLNESKIPVLCIPPELHPELLEEDSIGGMW